MGRSTEVRYRETNESLVYAGNQVEAHVAEGRAEEWHNEAGKGGRDQITKGTVNYK